MGSSFKGYDNTVFGWRTKVEVGVSGFSVDRSIRVEEDVHVASASVWPMNVDFPSARSTKSFLCSASVKLNVPSARPNLKDLPRS